MPASVVIRIRKKLRWCINTILVCTTLETISQSCKKYAEGTNQYEWDDEYWSNNKINYGQTQTILLTNLGYLHKFSECRIEIENYRIIHSEFFFFGVLVLREVFCLYLYRFIDIHLSKNIFRKVSSDYFKNCPDIF